MALKELIIKLFPSLYIKKNFSELNHSHFGNYKQKNIEPELLMLPYLLKPNQAFIDVGSNKGLFLFSALKFLKPSNIFGFEPNPVLFKKIKNVFKGIKIFNLALANKNGEAILTIPFTQNQPDDSLGTLNNNEVNENAFNFKVKVKTLDECVNEYSIKNIGLIKIDVEGHELDVIEGAKETIKKHLPTLIVEIEQRHHQEKIEKILADIIAQFNYDLYYFLPSTNKIISYAQQPIIHQHTNDFGTMNYVNNFIFIPSKNNPETLMLKMNSDIEKLQK
jgi:FkbM family methyltransferase